jgi:transcriptional regulator with PAS, ATPase and Fis domain/tetratricopeptide (TPR) repeat protein
MLARRLQAVAELLSTGHFRSALEELHKVYDDSGHMDRLFMAELLLFTGEREGAHAILKGLLSAPRLSKAVQAKCYGHLAYITKQREGVSSALALYEQSLQLAEAADDLDQVCRTQLWMLAAKADVHGPDSLAKVVNEVAWNIARLGDPNLLLFLHTTIAEIEARRSAFDLANRHIELATSLLERHANLWIEARLNLFRGAIAEPTLGLEQAIAFTSRALELAKLSGCALVESAATGNLAQLCVSAGKFDQATSFLEQASQLTKNVRNQRVAVLDARAQLELFQGRLDACEAWISQIDVPETDKRYVDLDNQATKFRLLQRRRDFSEALKVAELAVGASKERSARSLHVKYRLLRADILIDLNRNDDAQRAMHEIATERYVGSLRNLAEAERVRGRLAARLGHTTSARNHFDRSARILVSLGYLPSHNEVVQQANLELGDGAPSDTCVVQPDVHVSVQGLHQGPLEAAARLLEFAANLSLLGSEAVDCIKRSGASSRLVLMQVSDESVRVVESVGWLSLPEFGDRQATMRLEFGTAAQGKYELVVEPLSIAGAAECIAGIFSLISAAAELHEAQREQRERASLWPTDVVLQDSNPLFYGAKMREVRKQAMRLAPTDLKVLITGETGVGKEVVARLIHDASKRAGKSFEAVNCASVPRELFEAHLFGHRKGAFTGAVADQPGVIRGNDGGTIFFDEIGELSVEMQVKLLRVLDANQVHPIGAPNAVPVDFRAIAATNANLTELIEQKRFREDLFYRLNVAILHVPPLRERREEILPFVDHFLAVFCTRSKRPLLRVSDEAKEYLVLYNWPGNIRELRNEMERLCGMLEVNDVVRPKHLAAAIVSARKERLETAIEAGPNEVLINIDQPLASAYAEIDRHAIIAALKKAPNNLEAASKRLGVTRKALYNKRLRYSML